MNPSLSYSYSYSFSYDDDADTYASTSGWITSDGLGDEINCDSLLSEDQKVK